MEILRLPNTTAVEVSFTVPTASETYIISYQDVNNLQTYSASATSSGSQVATFELDSRYLTYTGTLVAEVMNSSSATVYRDGIDVVRPYCNIESVASKLGVTTSQTIQSEKVARKIIESEAGNFGFVRKNKEVYGMGMDYLMLDEPIRNLYYLYENGELIYDYEDENLQEYKISVDGSSIVTSASQVNKMEYQRVWRDRYLDTDFTSGFDYLVDGDFGYSYVPEDIQEACELLIQDIASNNLRYVNRYIKEFDNNEFKVKFSDGFQSGTGNMIADKILSRYKNRIIPGVI
jgi:hypothetical protein